MSARLATIGAALLLALGMPPGATRAAAPPACDAGCLHGLADAFLAGLESRKQGADVPWAGRVRYTENSVGMTVGDGIWASVTAHTREPLVVVDATRQSVVWMGAIEEHGQPGWLALRIKAQGGRIAEAEAVMRRKEGRPPFADPSAFHPDPAFARAAASPTARARLASIARAALPTTPRIRNGVSLGGVQPAALRGVAIAAVDTRRGTVALIGRRDHVGDRGDADGAFPHSYAFVTILKIADCRVVAGQEVQSDTSPFLLPAWEEH